MTKATITTCQCCGRAIKAATGVIAHHGYRRPGGGWQTASCFGARHVPYEVGYDALDQWRGALGGRIIPTTRKALQELQGFSPATIEWSRRDAYGRVLQQGEAARPEGFDGRPDYRPNSYATLYLGKLFKLRQELQQQEAALQYANERRAAWRGPNGERAEEIA